MRCLIRDSEVRVTIQIWDQVLAELLIGVFIFRIVDDLEALGFYLPLPRKASSSLESSIVDISNRSTAHGPHQFGHVISESHLHRVKDCVKFVSGEFQFKRMSISGTQFKGL